MAFYAIQPFGPLRDDMRFGTLCATVGNVLGGRRKSSDYFDTLKPARAGGDLAGWLALAPAGAAVEANMRRG